MTTFFPGPSRVYPQIANFMQDAYNQGILSISHRSETFNAMSEKTIGLLKTKLNIPSDYTVFYTSSATECWEIITQSLVRHKSVHFYSGAFGEKWYEYAHKIRGASEGFAFEANTLPDFSTVAADAEVICLTQNETSNGTQLRPEVLQSVREKYPEKLIAIDVTSSLAGISLPFEQADIWYGSVQKCFGMPAGLGLMVCSPRAIAQAEALGERAHYNSLLILHDNMRKWQTSCTPNVLGIYLLMRILETIPNISETDALIKQRVKTYRETVEQSKELSLLIPDEKISSDTIVAVKGTAEQVIRWKSEAKQNGILLGAGYGKWKETSFRIANFPALQPSEVENLLAWLKKQ